MSIWDHPRPVEHPDWVFNKDVLKALQSRLREGDRKAQELNRGRAEKMRKLAEEKKAAGLERKKMIAEARAKASDKKM